MYAKENVCFSLVGQGYVSFLSKLPKYDSWPFQLKKNKTHEMITMLSLGAYFGNYSREISAAF